MSWDHHHYAAKCKKCGAQGEKISSSDDWGRHEISWVNFSPYTDFPKHGYLVARKKIDENEYAICECGSTDIEIGALTRIT